MPPEDRTAPGGEELRRALEMAGSLLGKGPSDGGQSEGAGPDLAKLLEAMMNQRQEAVPEPEAAPATPTDSRMSAVLTALPQLMDAVSGKGDLVKPEKVNLVRAIKPYLPGDRAGSIDRAIRIANVTKAAKNALRLLGR